MFTEMLASAMIAALIIVLLLVIKKLMLMPVVLGRATELFVTLRVRGGEPRLEQTLESLKWMIDSGTLAANIIIEDLGMDEETRALALAAARDREYISVILDEDTEEWKTAPEISN